MKKLLLALTIAIFTTASVWSAAPNQINFQGLLTDTAGTPLSDGNYNVLFIIYDAPTSGNQIWSEVRTVALNDGLFTINLGAVTPLDETTFDSSPLYLAMQVGANPELSPRSLLVSVPWSMQSSRADFADEAGHATLADTASFAMSASGSGGSVFTRWGNSTAPAGTELIYSGYVFGSHYTHGGAIDLVVVKTGDPGDSTHNSMGLLYPAETETSGSPLSSIIPHDSKVKGAVCFSDRPTATIWGTHTPPDGWTTLYTGFAMGTHYSHTGPGGTPVCVDHLNFESETVGNQNGALLYPVNTQTSPYPVEAGLHGKLVKCVVCKKD